MQYKGYRIDIGIHPDRNPGRKTFYARYTIKDSSGQDVFVCVTGSTFKTVAACD